MKTGYIFPTILSANPHDGELSDIDNMVQENHNFAELAYYSTEKSPEILLDFGNKTTGYLFLEVEDSSQDSLLIQYGPRQDAMFFSRKVRVPANGRLWVDADHIAARYIRLSLVSDSLLPEKSWLKLKKVGLRFSAYSFIYRGRFQSSDPLLDDIWMRGAYTNHLCVQKADSTNAYKELLPEANKAFLRDWSSPYSRYIIMDGPRRDMESWLGDIRTEALTIYSAFGDYDVAKGTLNFFADLQDTKGKLPASSASRQEFKEYNLWWIVSLWECYLYSGDLHFLQQMYHTYKQCLDWVLFALDERGFMFNDRTWMWTIPRDGFTVSTQCILVYTLQCAAEIEQVLGNETAVAELRAQAEQTTEAINKHFWDEERGIYHDKVDLVTAIEPAFLDTNTYAIVFGIASEERSQRVLDFIRQNMWTPFGSTTLDIHLQNISVPDSCHHYDAFGIGRDKLQDQIEEMIYPHNRQIWPFVTAYEVEARFKQGDIQGALELIRNCWGNMAAQEPGTFWEMVDADTGGFPLKRFVFKSKQDVLNSASHGWSGWVSHLMSKYILGVKPTSPGFASIQISPNLGDLQFASGFVPTPQGVVKVKIERTGSDIEVTVEAPADVEITYDFSQIPADNQLTMLNGAAPALAVS